MESFLQSAKSAKSAIASLQSSEKRRILHEMADALRSRCDEIVDQNRYDIAYAKEHDLSSAMVDRLLLDAKRVEGMAQSLDEIAMLKEPVGRVIEGWMSDDGLRIEKVSVPIGVIGVIYESRPNVTSDVAGLCFKSGNIAILKGGKEAQNSNTIIAKVLQDVLEKNGLPRDAIALLPDSSREAVSKLIKMDKFVDLVIPRGGEGLIRFVNDNATVPVVKHDKGLCHLYVHADANLEKALEIALNAKVQRPGVCNAIETLLVDKAVANTFLPKLKEAMEAAKVELRGCATTRAVINVKEATEEDFHTEYLDYILSIKVVEDVESAIEHIAIYGSGHSDSIISENYSAVEKFLNSVDSACVYANASTRFTDGGCFGFGAEVGISTNKLHARGPMGINDLTTYKYRVYGSGTIRK